jgi:PAT family beta-lactamase induction signal transducer AmpG
MLGCYFRKHVLLLLVLGFASGAPFLLTLSTLSFWLSEQQVSKSVIGLFILVTLPYSFKFLWAPILDYVSLPVLGRLFGPKKAWGLAAQVCLMVSIICLGHASPCTNLMHTAFWAFMVSFFSATQDTLVDTLRIELLTPQEVGPGASMETIGFRLGMMLSGAGTLYLAATYSWKMAYTLLSLTVIAGMVALFVIEEPPPARRAQRNPQSLLRVYGHTWSILLQKPYFIALVAFIFWFKMGDAVLNAMVSPFLCDLGFSKIEFANVSKFFGISLMVCGGFLGGIIINHLGLLQSAIFCAALQAISCLLFVIQAIVGHNITVLFITIGIESLTSGLASATFIALLSSFCHAPFSASHFTLLYSLGSLSRVVVSSLAGMVADALGWVALFSLTSLAAVPAIYSLYQVKRKNQITQPQRQKVVHS